MPILRNPRHEAFAQNLAKGMTATKAYEKAGIEFAFPTQTLYLAGDPSRKLNVGTDSGGGVEQAGASASAGTKKVAGKKMVKKTVKKTGKKTGKGGG